MCGCPDSGLKKEVEASVFLSANSNVCLVCVGGLFVFLIMLAERVIVVNYCKVPVKNRMN